MPRRSWRRWRRCRRRSEEDDFAEDVAECYGVIAGRVVENCGEAQIRCFVNREGTTPPVEMNARELPDAICRFLMVSE